MSIVTAIEEALRCLAGAQKPLEYKQIFVDNFQNINSLSNKLLRAIIDNCGCNLFACGTDIEQELLLCFGCLGFSNNFARVGKHVKEGRSYIVSQPLFGCFVEGS